MNDIQDIKDLQLFKSDPLFAYFNILDRISKKLEIFSGKLNESRNSDIEYILSILRYEISSLIPEPVPGKDAVVDYDKIKEFVNQNFLQNSFEEQKIILALFEKARKDLSIDDKIESIKYDILNTVKDIIKENDINDSETDDSNDVEKTIIKECEHTDINIDNIISKVISSIKIPSEKKPYDIARELESLTGNDRLDYFSLKNRPGVPTYTENSKKGGGEGSSNTIVNVTNNYTAPDNSAILIVKYPIIVTLPKISSDSKKITITNQSSGEVTVSPYSGDLIHDDTSLIIKYHNSTAQLVSSSLGWIIV